jgi:Holliday junction resolvase RusA-like endonuclease
MPGATAAFRGAIRRHSYLGLCQGVPAFRDDRMISFHVPGEPVLFARGCGTAKFRVPLPCKRAYQTEISMLASQAMEGEPPLAGPIDVTIRVEYLIPKSWPPEKREVAVWKTTNGDANKIIRLCIDAMSKIVFADEAQIASLSIKKVYGMHARLFVSARDLSRSDSSLAGLLRIGQQTSRS